jgi:hypothetical protein
MTVLEIATLKLLSISDLDDSRHPFDHKPLTQ